MWFNTFKFIILVVKQNIGSYNNLSDQAKRTIKELLLVMQFNNNIKSTHKEFYTELVDLATNTSFGMCNWI